MKRLLVLIVEIIFIIFFLLLTITAPSFFSRADADQITFTSGRAVSDITGFFQGIVDGSSFHYMAQNVHRTFDETFPTFFRISLLYVFGSAFLSLCIAVLIGVFLTGKLSGAIQEILSFFSVVPDFLIALFLQVIFLSVNQFFGGTVVRIASIGAARPAILLPLITMGLTACVFLLRSIAERSRNISSQDYILFAKAKGLSKDRILLYHVFPGILDSIRGDLIKMVAITTGNLFIVELIFNIPGLTRMIFNVAFRSDRIYWALIRGQMNYHLNVAFFCLLGIAVIFFVTYLSLLALVRTVQRVLANG